MQQSREYHRWMLCFNHMTRKTFYTREEYEAIVGKQAMEEIMADFGSWENVYNYLRSEGFNLEPPQQASVNHDLPEHLIDALNRIGQMKRPTDFNQEEDIKKALVELIENFYNKHKFVPTIEQAAKEYSAYFPDVRHYLETFGTWNNACKEIKYLKPNQIPSFGDELKMTVAYYNRKHGKDPGKLMFEKDWDYMVEHLEKGKNIPRSHHIINFVTVDRKMRGRDVPRNGWQAVAEAANLNVDRRGRPQQFKVINDKRSILKNYTGACIKNGKLLSLEEWKKHCIDMKRGYRPPDARVIQSLFGSMDDLKKRAWKIIKTNEKCARKYLQQKHLRMAEQEVAVTRSQEHTGPAVEKSIWDKILELSPSQDHQQSVEIGYGRRIH